MPFAFFHCIVVISHGKEKRKEGMPLNLDGIEAFLVNGEQLTNKSPICREWKETMNRAPWAMRRSSRDDHPPYPSPPTMHSIPSCLACEYLYHPIFSLSTEPIGAAYFTIPFFPLSTSVFNGMDKKCRSEVRVSTPRLLLLLGSLLYQRIGNSSSQLNFI